jgi:hypothetical protein
MPPVELDAPSAVVEELDDPSTVVVEPNAPSAVFEELGASSTVFEELNAAPLVVDGKSALVLLPGVGVEERAESDAEVGVEVVDPLRVSDGATSVTPKDTGPVEPLNDISIGMIGSVTGDVDVADVADVVVIVDVIVLLPDFASDVDRAGSVLLAMLEGVSDELALETLLGLLDETELIDESTAGEDELELVEASVVFVPGTSSTLGLSFVDVDDEEDDSDSCRLVLVVVVTGAVIPVEDRVVDGVGVTAGVEDCWTMVLVELLSSSFGDGEDSGLFSGAF